MKITKIRKECCCLLILCPSNGSRIGSHRFLLVIWLQGFSLSSDGKHRAYWHALVGSRDVLAGGLLEVGCACPFSCTQKEHPKKENV